MLDSANGDAVGELAFFYSENESLFTQLERTPELRYTDDTVMAIGLAESILKGGHRSTSIGGDLS
jgi:ADP-ribosylglycohydrolase